MTHKYKFLDDINFPSDLKKLSESNLQELSNEVRKEMIDAVSETALIISFLTSFESSCNSFSESFFRSDGKFMSFKYLYSCVIYFFLKYNSKSH